MTLLTSVFASILGIHYVYISSEQACFTYRSVVHATLHMLWQVMCLLG